MPAASRLTAAQNTVMMPILNSAAPTRSAMLIDDRQHHGKSNPGSVAITPQGMAGLYAARGSARPQLRHEMAGWSSTAPRKSESKAKALWTPPAILLRAASVGRHPLFACCAARFVWLEKRPICPCPPLINYSQSVVRKALHPPCPGKRKSHARLHHRRANAAHLPFGKTGDRFPQEPSARELRSWLFGLSVMPRAPANPVGFQCFFASERRTGNYKFTTGEPT